MVKMRWLHHALFATHCSCSAASLARVFFLRSVLFPLRRLPARVFMTTRLGYAAGCAAGWHEANCTVCLWSPDKPRCTRSSIIQCFKAFAASRSNVTHTTPR